MRFKNYNKKKHLNEEIYLCTYIHMLKQQLFPSVQKVVTNTRTEKNLGFNDIHFIMKSFLK